MIPSPERTGTEPVPIVAVTAGDPAGVGPEIVGGVFSRRPPTGSLAVVVAAPPVVEAWGLTGVAVYEGVEAFEAAARGGSGSGLPRAGVVVLDTGVREPFVPGEPGPGGGRHAGAAVETAARLARNRSVEGIVTAPLSKKSLQEAGFPFPGHTEMLARSLNAPDCQMMMVHGALRVVPLTRHVALRDVPGRITGPAVETCVRVVRRALEADFGVADPRIAVAGLNPHAGEGGAVGREEVEVIAPALERLRGEGIDVDGPAPADALFPAAAEDHRDHPGRRGRYDAYVAMYHDQGLAPYKMLARRAGVNVTVGLPVVRTSVDHGTAFEIAGRGEADATSFVAAYALAEVLCRRRERDATNGAR